MALSLSATLKGLLTSPVNPASCSCARGLAVALTELASTSPALSGLAATGSSAAPAASARATPPSVATWGSSGRTARPSSPPSTTTTTTTTTTGVERVKAELKSMPPPPPELAADGLATAHDELWRRRFAAALL
jgi:hypothetical protein